MEWISVKDRLPSNDDEVLATDGEEPFSYVVAWYCGEWEVSSDMIDANNYDGGCHIYLDTPIAYWCEIEEPKKDINENEMD